MFFILSVLTCASSFAEEDVQLKLYSSDKKTYETILLIDYQKIRISKFCLKNQKMNCQAWTAIENKTLSKKETASMLGNPAAKFCLQQNAKNKILLDDKKREYDYCIFQDGSMVDAWNLYNKHH